VCIDGTGQRSSWIVMAGPNGSNPGIQFGPAEGHFTATGYRSGIHRQFTFHGMMQSAGVLEGQTTGVGFDGILVTHTAKDTYGWRRVKGQNSSHTLCEISSVGGDCLQYDSGAGGDAWYKCEFNSPGLGTDVPTYYNLKVRQTTQYFTGGYTRPTDV